LGRHTLLAGRYELLSPLGRGGMGQVWEAEDRRLRRPVAVKLLTDDSLVGHTQPEELARRFAREASVTAGLRHPGVPAVHDVGTYDGGLFLVLELITGRTLGDLMAEEGPLPVPWAAGIAAQVAAVLAAAHQGGLVHRDVKPQNVMLTGDGAVKVLDFGVAALVDQSTISRITRTGQPIGTPAYMAPEQLRGRSATARTDLYALGCVLYEMLAGDGVFNAASPAELMHLQLEQAPAPLRRDDLHPELHDLVRQLLEKDPARRPADARETYDRLMPHVLPPGPLGDIDLTDERQADAHLYSRALVRLTGPHDPPPARLTVADQPVSMPRPAGAVPSADAMPPPNGAPPMPGAWPLGNASAMGAAGALGGVPPAYGPPSASGGAWTDSRISASPPGPHGVGWKVLHSLWMLPTLLFGMATWLSFGYIAARHRRPTWLVAAVVYLVLAVVAFALVGSAPANKDTPQSTAGMVLGLLLWPAGIIHALWINATTRLRLRDQHDRLA
jgi:serine/threonine protein kinase